MTRIRTLVAAMVIALPVPAAVAGCGGGGSSNNEDPQQVLNQTFNNPTKVTSGHLNITLSGSAQGAQSGNLSATIDGPFQGDASNPNAFPQLNLTAKINASGAGQSLNFDGALIATKDNAYVEYQGQAYEVGTSIFRQFAKSYEQAASQSQAQGSQSTSSIFKQFGVDPSKWLTNVSNEGTTNVEGTDTIHIHGDADLAQILSDFAKIAQRAPTGTAPTLTPQQLDQVKSAVKTASVDVYSGTSDHLLRKLALALTIAPPASAGTSVSSVNVNFSITLSDVNKTQTITAPSGAKPISGLLSQLGISGLGSIGGGSLPNIPGTSGGSSGSSGGSTGGGGGPSQAYLKCIQGATSPSDFNKCAQKLG